MVVLATNQFEHLTNHMIKKDHKLHLRKAHYVNGERTLEYATIMKVASPTRILCHSAGPSVDFEFEIIKESTGAIFQIMRNAGTLVTALKILEKEKKRILERIESEDENNFRRTKEGQFYINRVKVGRVTSALTEAIETKTFPKAFADNLVEWGFIVVKGRPKQP